MSAMESLEFNSEYPCKNSGMVVCAYNSSTGEVANIQFLKTCLPSWFCLIQEPWVPAGTLYGGGGDTPPQKKTEIRCTAPRNNQDYPQASTHMQIHTQMYKCICIYVYVDEHDIIRNSEHMGIAQMSMRK